MSYLPSGFILTPDREKDFDRANGEPPGFCIEKVLGSGGFGVTYLATRTGTAGVSEYDLSDILWLPPGAQVVVKEFVPRDMSSRDPETYKLEIKEDFEEPFHVFLARFRKEAERLFLFTCLRTIKAADRHLDQCLNTTHGQPIEQFEAWKSRSEQISQFYRNLPQSRISEAQMVQEALEIICQFDPNLEKAAKDVLGDAVLPTVYDYFEANDTAYYIMEYLKGGDLKQKTSQRKVTSNTEIALDKLEIPMPFLNFRAFASRMLDALDELHNTIPERGLIHCDIKPNNIMFRTATNDLPVLIDVGLSRSMQNELDDSESIVPGLNFRYGAWELEREADRLNRGLKRGNEIGPWTDLFSMAIVFLELATSGKPNEVPGLAKSDDQTGKNHAKLAQLGPGYPSHIGKALVAALQHDFRARPQSVSEWRAMLALDRAEQITDPLPPPPQGNKRLVLLGLSGIALAGICAVVALMVTGGGSPSDEIGTPPDTVASTPIASAAAQGGDGDSAGQVDETADPDVAEASPEQPTASDAQQQRSDEQQANAGAGLAETEAVRQEPIRASLASGTWRDFPRLGFSARPIVQSDKVAGLAAATGRRPNQPMRARSLAGSTFPAGVTGATEFVSACDGGSALAALQAAENGSGACLVTQLGAKITIGN